MPRNNYANEELFNENDQELLVEAEEAKKDAEKYRDDVYCGVVTSDSFLKQIIKEMAKQSTLLSAEEVKTLVQKRDSGNESERKAAIKELASHNYRLMISIIKKYANNNDDLLGQLISPAYNGLEKAAETFNPKKAVFSTHATNHIRWAISKEMPEILGKPVLPEKYRKLSSDIQRVKEELTERLYREPTMQEIAGVLNVSVEEIDEVLTLTQTPDSIDRTLGNDGENDTTVGDMIADESYNPAKTVFRSVMADSLHKMLHGVVSENEWVIFNLSKEHGCNSKESDEKLSKILSEYYGIKMTAEEICKKRRTIRQAVEKLCVEELHTKGYDKSQFYDYVNNF